MRIVGILLSSYHVDIGRYKTLPLFFLLLAQQTLWISAVISNWKNEIMRLGGLKNCSHSFVGCTTNLPWDYIKHQIKCQLLNCWFAVKSSSLLFFKKRYSTFKWYTNQQLLQKLEKAIKVSLVRKHNQTDYSVIHLNPFVPNATFLYPLKTSENFKVFWCFQG